jgi:hypothetical protein
MGRVIVKPIAWQQSVGMMGIARTQPIVRVLGTFLAADERAGATGREGQLCRDRHFQAGLHGRTRIDIEPLAPVEGVDA